MQTELMMALARIYTDHEWALSGKLPFPTEDRLDWIGLDYARLQWLIKNGYVNKYIAGGEARLSLTAEALDSLCMDSFFLKGVLAYCNDCEEYRASCADEFYLPEGECACAVCKAERGLPLSSAYLDYKNTYMRLPIPVIYKWDGEGYVEV